MPSKRKKEYLRVANVASDFMILSVTVFLQAVALILIACLVKDRAWTYWVILAALTLSALYFGFMFFYRLYRGRLTFVKIEKNGLTYSIRYKRAFIAADDLVISPIDDVKQSKKYRYGYIYDKRNENDGFVFAVNIFKSLEKIKDHAPHALLVFSIMCTDEQTLTIAAEKARADDASSSSEYAELIEQELECRKQALAEAEKTKRRKKRRH